MLVTKADKDRMSNVINQYYNKITYLEAINSFKLGGFNENHTSEYFEQLFKELENERKISFSTEDYKKYFYSVEKCLIDNKYKENIFGIEETIDEYKGTEVPVEFFNNLIGEVKEDNTSFVSNECKNRDEVVYSLDNILDKNIISYHKYLDKKIIKELIDYGVVKIINCRGVYRYTTINCASVVCLYLVYKIILESEKGMNANSLKNIINIDHNYKVSVSVIYNCISVLIKFNILEKYNYYKNYYYSIFKYNRDKEYRNFIDNHRNSYYPQENKIYNIIKEYRIPISSRAISSLSNLSTDYVLNLVLNLYRKNKILKVNDNNRYGNAHILYRYNTNYCGSHKLNKNQKEIVNEMKNCGDYMSSQYVSNIIGIKYSQALNSIKQLTLMGILLKQKKQNNHIYYRYIVNPDYKEDTSHTTNIESNVSNNVIDKKENIETNKIDDDKVKDTLVNIRNELSICTKIKDFIIEGVPLEVIQKRLDISEEELSNIVGKLMMDSNFRNKAIFKNIELVDKENVTDKLFNNNISNYSIVRNENGSILLEPYNI